VPRESKPERIRRTRRIAGALKALYPAQCALTHDNPFQLLIATILSAQCTDQRVNIVTPKLFARFKTPDDFANADPKEVESIIRSTGFFRAKTRSIIGASRGLVVRHGGVIPRSLDLLVQLPGVGRKTANVVLGTAFGLAEGVVVDTHVGRLARRMKLTAHTDPVKIERDLIALLPRKVWIEFSHRMIWHGRAICVARRPRCEQCPLVPDCPGAKDHLPTSHRAARPG